MKKNTPGRKGRLGILGGVIALTLACTMAQGSATIIVDWGGDYVSANQVFRNTTTSDPNAYRSYTNSGQSYSVLKDSFQNLTPGSGYTAPTGKTSNFYGGFMSSSGSSAATLGGATGTTSAINARAVVNSGTADMITLALSTATAQIRGAVLFNKSDFLNSTSSQTIIFDSDSSLTFKGIMGGYRPVGRWMVLDGSTWYISLATITQTASNTVETHTLNNLNTALWAVYNPRLTDTAGTYLLNAAPTTGYAQHTFTDIQSMGIFMDSYGEAASVDGSSYSRFALAGFTAHATAIPEPSTLALSLGALGCVAFLRRSRFFR